MYVRCTHTHLHSSFVTVIFFFVEFLLTYLIQRQLCVCVCKQSVQYKRERETCCPVVLYNVLLYDNNDVQFEEEKKTIGFIALALDHLNE